MCLWENMKMEGRCKWHWFCFVSLCYVWNVECILNFSSGKLPSSTCIPPVSWTWTFWSEDAKKCPARGSQRASPRHTASYPRSRSRQKLTLTQALQKVLLLLISLLPFAIIRMHRSFYQNFDTDCKPNGNDDWWFSGGILSRLTEL